MSAMRYYGPNLDFFQSENEVLCDQLLEDFSNDSYLDANLQTCSGYLDRNSYPSQSSFQRDDYSSLTNRKWQRCTFCQCQHPDITVPLSEHYLARAPNVSIPFGTGKEHVPTVSSQSVAARERRRRITEKTRQLGMLIPGGNKLNTAEMLQAAYKYVKFLQAQVAILHLRKSTHQETDGADDAVDKCRDLEYFLSSTVIQEKLYMHEKSFSSIIFIKSLIKRDDIASNVPLCRELMSLVPLSLLNSCTPIIYRKVDL